MKRIYLDNNASTPLDPRVINELSQTLLILEGNPSSTHSSGQKARSFISKARSAIASFLGVKGSEILFTSGGTESANMILSGLADLQKGGHIISSTAEHSCVYSTLKQLESSEIKTTFLTPGVYGAVQPEAVKAAIRPDTKLITLMAVNNETGVKTDIEAIAAIAQQHGIKFMVDGVALLGKELFTIPPGVSAMTFSGHKFHALQGSGFVYLRSGVKLNALIMGGEQEFGLRAGTENVIGIVSLAKAIVLLSIELPIASERMQALRDKFEKTLFKALGNVSINGRGPRIANVSNLAFEGMDGETLLMKLDQKGIAASHGSACSSGALEPSRILLSMGLPLNTVRSSIRFSLSRFTTEQEIDTACAVIIDAVTSK